MSRCTAPRATKRVIHTVNGGVRAYCSGCKTWKSAAQVAWGKELRNTEGRILATFAPLPH